VKYNLTVKGNTQQLSTLIRNAQQLSTRDDIREWKPLGQQEIAEETKELPTYSYCVHFQKASTIMFCFSSLT
jgi:hypothetical protein